MGHFYDKQGKPCYIVNGRDATLRDARKNEWVQSVTETTQIMAKPALTNWLIDQAIMAALTLPRIEGESDAAMLERIKVDGRAQAKAAAEEGGRIHDACEKLVKGESFDEKYRPHAEAARAELHKLFPDVNDWIAEQSFAHPMGFGGKCDLHSPSTGIVCDYKTKDGDFSDGKKLNWDQNLQLAAYQVGLLLAPADTEFPQNFIQCANIFVSRTHPGAVASHVWSANDIADGWAQFEAALRLWKLVKKYDGAF